MRTSLDKRKIIIQLKKLPFAVLGMLCISIGVAVYLRADIGSDPNSVFFKGLGSVLGAPKDYVYTVGSLIVNAIFITILFFTSRRLIGVATVFALCFSGLFTDMFEMFFSATILSDAIMASMNIWWRIILYILGTIVIGFGGGLYMSTDLGGAPADMLPLMLSEKVPVKFRYVRMMYDFTMLGGGLLLGSTAAGWGSVISAFCIGPFFSFFLNKFTPVFAKFR